MLGHWRASPHKRRVAGAGEKYGKVTRFGELVLGDHILLEAEDFWSVARDKVCLASLLVVHNDEEEPTTSADLQCPARSALAP